MIGVSRMTLWRMVQAGSFPPPVRITERNRGYLREAVEAWMKDRAEGRPLDASTVRSLTASGAVPMSGLGARNVRRRAG
jgi:hypothetical protein